MRGSAVAHTADGTLLTGDTIAGCHAPGWVSFPRNYPRHVPMSAAVVRRIVETLEPYDYDRLYTLGVTGILTAYAVAEKKPLWQLNTLKEFGAANLFFGVSTSPLLEGDNLLVNVGGKGASVVAFDRSTGKVAWKTGDDPPVMVVSRQVRFLRPR